MTKPALLFVCLGNICRSPLAEAAFRLRASKAGLEYEADSCGTAAYHIGSAPDPRSIATAAVQGIDIAQYQGRQLMAEDFTRFTHIFAMDHSNLADILSVAPTGSTAKIALLMDNVAGREGAAIADPYYDGGDQFGATWADVDAAAKALIAKLQG